MLYLMLTCWLASTICASVCLRATRLFSGEKFRTFHRLWVRKGVQAFFHAPDFSDLIWNDGKEGAIQCFTVYNANSECLNHF